jgi:hypothetical protein
MEHSFTCCVGSGMENHALHGQNTYFESDDTLWVNLFMPSTAHIDTGALRGVRIDQTTDFPEGEKATLTLTVPAAKRFTLAVRRPTWAGDGFRIAVNGEALTQPTAAALRASGGGRASREEEGRPQPSTYVEIDRTWKTGDKVELTLPKSLRLEPTPDQPQVAAIMWGPLVLAGDLGPRREGRGRVADGSATNAPAAQPVPVLVTGGKSLAEWVVPAGNANEFTAKGVARIPEQAGGAGGDVPLLPFYRTHRRRYSGYFDILTPAQFEARGAALAAARERARKLEAATVGFAQPGEMQPERDFNYQSEPVERPVLRADGRANRAGTGWFSFDLPVDATAPTAVVVTYLNSQGLAPASGDFQILVDGTPVGKFEGNATAVGFWDAQYAVPADLVKGKSKITVKFQAGPNGRIAPVFGVRTVRVGAM